MTERPIIFSGPMVCAIIAGRKTQTRRVNIKNRARPYYAQDRLWVRETFAAPWGLDYKMPGGQRGIFYRAAHHESLEGDGRWTPAIHMPRAACRLELDVIEVRVERLQDITDKDAQAEGARHFPSIPIGMPFKYGSDTRWSMEDNPPNTDHCLISPRMAFANFWEKLNEKRGFGWDTNPLVWVVEFKPVQQPQVEP